MNTFDIVVLVLLLFGAVGGFRKGFLLEIVGIIALVLGVFGAIKLLQVGMDFMQEHFAINNQFLPYITFIVLFVLIILGVNLLGRIIKTAVHLTPLGMFDNIAGAAIGALKWAVGISFLLWATSIFGFAFFESGEESFLYKHISGIAPWLVEQIQLVAPYFKEIPVEEVPEVKEASV